MVNVVTTPPGVWPATTRSVATDDYNAVKAEILRMDDGDRLEAAAIQEAADMASKVLDRRPKFTLQPTDETAADPATATFDVTVTGTPTPEVRWYYRQGDGPWEFAGVGSPDYTTPATVPGDDGKVYKAVAKNYKGEVHSDEVTLTIT